MSDHGCHFMTRNEEYKRSPHNSSLRVPLLIDGPGFEGARQIQEIVGPLASCAHPAGGGGRAGAGVDAGQEPDAAVARRQGSGSMAEQGIDSDQRIDDGRAIRTKEWTYCVADPSGSTTAPASANYHEYQMYDSATIPRNW